jgi:signal transduction histidine kinase
MGNMPMVHGPAGKRPDAGEISLQIAKIAGLAVGRNALASELAHLLSGQLAADGVALFWLEGSAPRPGPHRTLGTLAVASSSSHLSLPRLERLLKVTAYQAYSKQATVSRHDGSMAVPFGTPEPFGVCAAWWEPDSQPGGVPSSGELSILAELRASLTLAFMPARLSEAHLSDQQGRAGVVARDGTLLGAADRVHANFISMVSHELRTPLNSINGFLEVVLEGQVGQLNSRQQEFLGYVQTSAFQLTTLVEDILFISKADSGQFVLRPGSVSVSHLLHQAMQGVVPEAEKARVHIVVSVPEEFPPIWGDELRLCQVITNLLHNAIKFSPPESEITLSVTDRGTHAEFAVQDQGEGVAPEEHLLVFERFYQSDSSRHAHSGGYGLGLAIAKLIVLQHHGRIWLESGEGQGTTFYFTLPFDPGEAGSGESPVTG